MWGLRRMRRMSFVSHSSPLESRVFPANLPTLGVGLGFREPFRGDLFLARDRVDFLEITADHYFDPSPEKARELALLADHFTLIPHGLNLSLGTAEGLDPDYLGKFEALVTRLNPPWWSEHVAFTRAGGFEIGHLAPVPFSREALDVLEANIAEATRRIGTPLIVENITYTIPLPGREMGEGSFLAELTRRTGCGLLLDVTNLYTNAVNHGFDPSEVLDQLPLDRVVQLHFAGGEWHDGQLLDSHARPTSPEVWSLLEEVIARAPIKGIILERDDDFPPFGEILDEVARARSLMKAHGRWV
jgi:uncharacterized protein (UPF0276 family)